MIERFTTLRREHPRDVRTAADEIVGRLRRLGVPVEVHEPEIFLSLPGKASVRVGSKTYRAKPLAMSRSVPEGLTAPLVFCPTEFDPNTDQVIGGPRGVDTVDVRGKIVVAEGFGMSSMALHFDRRGALGLIAVNPGKNAHWGICSTIWGSPDLRDLPRKPTLVVVSVNSPDGQALMQLAKDGCEVSLFAELEEGWYASPVPVVTIPGTDEPDQFVLLHGHYDSWDFGIGDNAVGDATMLEVARVLWQHRSALKRSVRIAWWPGHSTGRYAGSTWFADHFAIDLYEHCIAQVNCDSPGCRWATEYIDVAWMSEAESFAQAVIKEVTGKAARGERPYQAGDYSFNNIGISSYFMLLSTMSPEDRASKGYYTVGGCGANIAWHTEEDLIEIADRNILVTDMKIYLLAIMAAANATIAPFDFQRTVDEFGATLAKYQTAAGTVYGFDRTRSALADLRLALQQFGAFAGTLASLPVGDLRVRRANHAIRRLARLLVPVNYTTGANFFHDPAEQVPPLPDLAPALEIPKISPDQRGFYRTHLTRGENRLVAALRDARATLSDAMA